MLPSESVRPLRELDAKPPMKDTVIREEIVVIDDNASCQDALKELFESVGLKVGSTHRGGLSWKMAFQTPRVAWCSM